MIWGVLPIFHAFKHILSIPSLPELLCIASLHEPLGIQLPSSSKVHAWSNNQKVWVAELCLTLGDPMNYNLPGSSVHGILQARILEWVRLPFSSPGDLYNPGTEPGSPVLQADSLLPEGSPCLQQILLCSTPNYVLVTQLCKLHSHCSPLPSSAEAYPEHRFTWPGSTQNRKCLGVYIPATQGSRLMNAWCRKGKVHLPCPELGQTAV